MKQKVTIIVLAFLCNMATWGAETDPIHFADANVKSLCVANWDTNGDGELSEAEAAAVIDIGTVFQNNTEISSFSPRDSLTDIYIRLLQAESKTCPHDSSFRTEEIHRELQRRIHEIPQQLSCVEQFRELFQENNPGTEGCPPEFRDDYSQTGHV